MNHIFKILGKIFDCLVIGMIIIAFTKPVVFGAAANMYVTVAGAGVKDGSDWDNAFGYAEWETDVEGSVEAGDRYYIEAGNYVFTSALTTATDGTAADPIQFIGVASGTSNEPPDSSDYPTGSNRPTMTTGANGFIMDNFVRFENLRFEGTGDPIANTDAGGVWKNNYGNNSSGSGNRGGLISGDRGVMVDCEAECVNGRAIMTGPNVLLLDCYMHDSDVGVWGLSSGLSVVNSIFNTCTTGVQSSANRQGFNIINNTFYSGTLAVDLNNQDASTVYSNIIDAYINGIDADNPRINILDHNVYDVSGQEVVTGEQGDNKVSGDPGLTDPTGTPPDFTVGSGSNVLDAGFQFGLTITGGALAGDYKINSGVDQDDNIAAGAAGGGRRAGWSIQ